MDTLDWERFSPVQLQNNVKQFKNHNFNFSILAQIWHRKSMLGPTQLSYHLRLEFGLYKIKKICIESQAHLLTIYVLDFKHLN